MGSNPPQRLQRVSDWKLRRLFNQGKYWRQAQSGILRERILQNGHPSSPLAGEPYCTHSQMISYLDAAGNEVARVHQYLRPDGTIGLSGKPDPKRLLVNGTLYILRT